MLLQSGVGVSFIKLTILQAKAGAELLTCSTFLVVLSFLFFFFLGELGGGGGWCCNTTVLHGYWISNIHVIPVYFK